MKLTYAHHFFRTSLEGKGGGKKKKQLLGFILSPVRLVSTTPASLAQANQETLEPEFAV